MTESSIGFATVLFITTKTEKSRKEYETTIQAESNFGDSEGSEGTNYPRSSRVNTQGKVSLCTASKIPFLHHILSPPNI